MIRKWIAKQIARYEHAARRAQLPIWLVIAINTFLEVVWDTVPLEIVLFLYAVGIIAAVIIGYISHKLRVGSGIVMQQFDIESRELWDIQSQANAGRFARCVRMSNEELEVHLDYFETKLNLQRSKGLGDD